MVASDGDGADAGPPRSQTVTVVEADCLVSVGATIRVPFQLTVADDRADVLLLSDAAAAFDLHLEAPDGTVVAGSAAGVEQVVGDSSRFVELHPRVAATSAPTGRWTAVLRLDDARLAAWHDRVRDRLATVLDAARERPAPAMAAVARPRRVPASVVVAATSTLRLETILLLPTTGTTRGELRARVVDDGAATLGRTRVEAHVTAPDGGVRLVRLARHGEEHAAPLGTRVDEVAQVRVVARGVDAGGTPFTREQILRPSERSAVGTPPPTPEHAVSRPRDLGSSP